MKTPFVCFALALTLTSLSSSPVLAQDEADRRAAFESARSAMQAKRWADAHQLFVALWEKQRTYDVALHLGQVEYHLQRFRDAATHLAFGLALLPPREKPEIAERSRALLDLCKQEVGTLELSIKNKNATLLVDGVMVAEAPLVTDTYVEPGGHRFEVRLDGHTPELWEAAFGKGSQQRRIVQLKPLANASDNGTVAAASSTSGPSPLGAGHRVETTESDPTAVTETGGWVPVIAGSALALVGLGSGLTFELLRSTRDEQAASLRERIASQTNTDNGCSTSSASKEVLRLCSQLTDRNSDYDTYGKLELASLALAGGAIVATATYFVITRPDRARAAETKKADVIRIDPLMGWSSAGLQVSGTF